MKKIIRWLRWGATLPALCVALAGHAQTVVFADDFEATGGPGPGTFTVVNGTATNQWTAGPAAGNGPTQAGSTAAYISSTAASTRAYAYSTYQSSTVHLYRDVPLPAGFDTFEVSFDWKGRGEAADYLSVFALPGSYVLQEGFVPFNLRGGAQLNPAALQGQAAYGRLTYTLPNSPVLAGSIVRLTFTWTNNSSGGTQPPAAIDNVVITARNTGQGLAGTYTIDNTLPASATNFASFSAAVARLNQALPTAPVTFNVPAGRVFAEAVPSVVVGGTAAAPVTFRKLGTGANPAVEATAGAVLDIAGADYLTFDGIDVRAGGTGRGPAWGYRVRNFTPTNGVRHLTIQNATVTLNRTYTSTIGVVQAANGSYGSVTPADTSGNNAHTRYRNLLIQNSYEGIAVLGYTSTFTEYDAEVDHCTVGNGTAGDIGDGTVGLFATRAENVRRLRFHHNIIQGARCTDGTLYGLFLSNPLGSGPDASLIYSNRIRNIRHLSSGVATTGNVVYGIYLSMSATGSQDISLFNNEISELYRAYPPTAFASSSFLIQGIYVPSLTQPSNLLLAHNTIVVNGDQAPTGSSVALNLGSFGSAQGVFTLRNNLLANLTGAQAGTSARHVAFYSSSRLLASPGSSADYNNYFVAEPEGGLVVGSSTASYATLAGWQAASLMDQHSHDLNPRFAAGSLVPASQALDNQGTPLAAVPLDLTDAPRAATPDVGAVEFLGAVLATPAAAGPAPALRAWPNPFGRTLSVAAAPGIGGRVEVLDLLGRAVLAPAVLAPGQATALPGAGLLPAGCYLLRLTQPNGHRQTLRLVRD